MITAALDDAKSGRAGRRHSALAVLDQLPPEVSAYLATRVAINSAISQRGLTNAAVQIGTAIEEELRMIAFDDQEPGLYATIMRQLRERGSTSVHAGRVLRFAGNKANVKMPTLTKTEKIHLGVRLVELLIEATGFIEIVNVRTGRKTKAVVRACDKVHDWLRDHNSRAELLSPQFAPMVVPPRDWEGIRGGGYLHPEFKQLPLVKGAGKRHRELLESADLSTVLESLNAIQRTPWRINAPVLDVMLEVWERELEIAMPHMHDKMLPSKPAGHVVHEKSAVAWANVTPQAKATYMVAARKVHEENNSTRGKRILIAQLLQIAAELRDEEAIFFPHQLDFRGCAFR